MLDRDWLLHERLGIATLAKRGGPPPINTALPTITGTFLAGETLTYVAGTWTGAEVVTHEWYVDGVATGQTGATYDSTGDGGTFVTVRETATFNGARATADSAAHFIASDQEVVDLFARFGTEPSDDHKCLFDAFIHSVVTAGAWDNLDALYVGRDADADGQLNWVQDAYNLTKSGAVTITDGGFLGDGTSYLDSGFNPTTASSPKFTQDSAHMFFYALTNLADGGSQSNDLGNTNSCLVRNVSEAGRVTGRPNMSANKTIANGGYPGHTGYNRVDSANWEGYAQGVRSWSVAEASAALTNSSFHVLSVNGFGNPGVNKLGIVHWGSALTQGKVAAIDAAATVLLQGLGALDENGDPV